MPAAKEKPILFSGPMVRAILDGKKTQTRRPIKPQPDQDIDDLHGGDFRRRAPYPMECSETGRSTGFGFEDDHGHCWQCPFGPPGTLLWVRETWIELDKLDWFERNKPRDWLVDFIHPHRRNGVVYRAEISKDSEELRAELGYRWRPSIHMPRWASRINLRVKRVWVERVQDISEEDARAEGITDGGCLNCGDPEPCGCSDPQPDARDSFVALWQFTYPGSWDANEWVWACEFERAIDAT